MCIFWMKRKYFDKVKASIHLVVKKVTWDENPNEMNESTDWFVLTITSIIKPISLFSDSFVGFSLLFSETILDAIASPSSYHPESVSE